MKKNTAWDVFLKTKELSGKMQSGKAVPINIIAEELSLGADIVEQYAISLHILDVLQFDRNSKEIMLLHGNAKNCTNYRQSFCLPEPD